MSSTPQLRLHLGHPAPGHASSSVVGQVELTTQSVAHGEKRRSDKIVTVANAPAPGAKKGAWPAAGPSAAKRANPWGKWCSLG